MRATGQATSIIKKYEGLSLHSYQCPGGEWTIGYGQTGQHIGPGLTITEYEAEQWLLNHVGRVEKQVSDLIKVKLSQQQFDALVSLVYNIGIGAFAHSTLLKFINNQQFVEAGTEILRWDHVRGTKMPGLTARRAEEFHLFRS